jgi:hypothetical protein
MFAAWNPAQPEISDVVVRHDSDTLVRLAVRKQMCWLSLPDSATARPFEALPDRDGVLEDRILISAHWEMQRLAEEFYHGGMLWIFGPYAALVLVNILLRLVPSTDIQSATSVAMLGPLTAIRPLVMMVGVFNGIWSSALWETRLLGSFVLALMLGLEYLLNLRAAREQSRELDLLQSFTRSARPRPDPASPP